MTRCASQQPGCRPRLPCGGGGGPAAFQGHWGSSSFGVFVFESCSFPLAQAQLLWAVGRTDRKGRGPSCGACCAGASAPPPRPSGATCLGQAGPPCFLPQCPVSWSRDLAHRAGSQGSSHQPYVALIWPDMSSEPGVAGPVGSGFGGQACGVSESRSTRFGSLACAV